MDVLCFIGIKLFCIIFSMVFSGCVLLFSKGLYRMGLIWVVIVIFFGDWWIMLIIMVVV